MGKIADFFSPRIALVAAAEAIRLDDRKEQERQKRRGQEWQQLAWTYYDQVPEINFAMNYVANSLRRVSLYPAVQPDPQQPPQALDVTTGIGQRANAELDRLRSVDGTHGTLIHDFALQLSIPGEGWLVGLIDEETDDEEWFVCSESELKTSPDGKWMVLASPGDREGRVIRDDEPVPVRVWRPHPRWRNLADSSMRAVVELCDELVILGKDVRATGRSRINAGILWLPNGMKLRTVDGRGQGIAVDGEAKTAHPFVQAMVEAIALPIQDEGTPSAIAPTIVFANGDHIQQARHMTFGREFSKIAKEMREELRERIGVGIDLPTEVITGKSNLNHWTAWQVSEETFDAHLAPLVQLICAGVTEGFLRPALGEEGQDVMVWYDASQLVAHPNRAQDADAAFDKITILSDAAYRKYKGYAESDAPTEEEIALRIKIRQLSSPLALSGILDSGSTVEEQIGGDTSSSDAAGDAIPEVEPTAEVASAGPAPSGAGGLGRRLLAVDRSLRTGLHAAADHVARVALESLTADAADDELARHVARLRPDYDKLVRAAQTRSLALVAAAARVADEELDEFVESAREQQAEDRDAGWAVLAALMTASISAAATSPESQVIGGEFDPTVVVPAGVIRDAMAVAGGSPLSVSPVTGAPPGGVATGATVTTLQVRVGLRTVGWEWVYGDVGSRGAPFPPHERLDGVEFDSWQSPVLAVTDEGAWLGVDYYYPGDHLYCQCDFAPAVEAAAEEAA